MDLILHILLWYGIITVSLGFVIALLGIVLNKEIDRFHLTFPILFPFYVGLWILSEICLHGPVTKLLLYTIETRHLNYKCKKIHRLMDERKFRISAFDRLRIDTDGEGVTTLVVLNKCPLNCKYCINPKARTLRNHYELVSHKRLYRHLLEDDLYFQASGGGVTFDGGEPLLQADKIKELKKVCPSEWKITVETSLNVDIELVKSLADIIDHWMIDIKDMNPRIYKAYTGKSNKKVIKNLKWMVRNGLCDKMEMLIPMIPDFNNEKDISNSKNILNGMGLTNHTTFEYLVTNAIRNVPPISGCPLHSYYSKDLFTVTTNDNTRNEWKE